MVIGSRRMKLPARAEPVAVTITGEGWSGDNESCCVIIGGVVYVTASSGIEAMTGDTIVFSMYTTAQWPSSVMVDGTQVYVTTGHAVVEAYEWTVPKGVTQIDINMAYTLKPAGLSCAFTVTTS